jgi:hypothetical protein
MTSRRKKQAQHCATWKALAFFTAFVGAMADAAPAADAAKVSFFNSIKPGKLLASWR